MKNLTFRLLHVVPAHLQTAEEAVVRATDCRGGSVWKMFDSDVTSQQQQPSCRAECYILMSQLSCVSWWGHRSSLRADPQLFPVYSVCRSKKRLERGAGPVVSCCTFTFQLLFHKLLIQVRFKKCTIRIKCTKYTYLHATLYLPSYHTRYKILVICSRLTSGLRDILDFRGKRSLIRNGTLVA